MEQMYKKLKLTTISELIKNIYCSLSLGGGGGGGGGGGWGGVGGEGVGGWGGGWGAVGVGLGGGEGVGGVVGGWVCGVREGGWFEWMIVLGFARTGIPRRAVMG